jgi:hypothetical protein
MLAVYVAFYGAGLYFEMVCRQIIEIIGGSVVAGMLETSDRIFGNIYVF